LLAGPNYFVVSVTTVTNEMTGDIISEIEEAAMNRTSIANIVLVCLLLAGCNLGSQPASTQELIQAPLVFITTETPSPMPQPLIPDTPIFTPTATSIPAVNANFCTDPQVMALIDSLKTAMRSSDGALLSSLVSPTGMEVRYFHDGEAITYSAYQATFLFETTYVINWGVHPASGLKEEGSFHDVIVPDLVKIFNQSYTVHCNELRHPETNYPVSWPYQKDFYSIYYAGSPQNGNMDWNTWGVGIEYVNARPYIYALTQFFWEP